MKITANNYPFLTKDINHFSIDEDSNCDESTYYILGSAFELKSTKYLHFTDSFIKAAWAVRDKILSLLFNLEHGIYFIGSDGVHEEGEMLIYKTNDVCHVLEINKYEVWNHARLMNSDSDDLVKHLKLVSVRGFTNKEIYDTKLEFIDSSNSVYSVGKLIGLLFYQFADVEILTLNAQKKRGHLNNCKYVSETNTEIQIVDSTWFTTLVHSEAFKVRGHFALRAHGEGRTQRRLVWISDYQKDGYTRTAGIEKYNNSITNTSTK